MRTIAINDTLAGVLALTCALTVCLATAFEASTVLGPAAPVDAQRPAGTSALAEGP